MMLSRLQAQATRLNGLIDEFVIRGGAIVSGTYNASIAPESQMVLQGIACNLVMLIAGLERPGSTKADAARRKATGKQGKALSLVQNLRPCNMKNGFATDMEL